MRIERENGDSVGSVWAVCSRKELQDLLDSLVNYFDEDPPDSGWHCHVGGSDQDLTIAIEGA
jgi:hypothetical protein